MVRTSKVALTIVTAASLVLSMFALAIQAFADTNNPAPWHTHYFTENVEFKAGVPGDSFQFVVQYTNGGSQSWVKGAVNKEARLGTGWTFGDPANPVDNTNDFNGGWSSNWLASNRIAAQTESTVLPGTNATFTYTAKIPASAGAGKHQIKGQPVIDGVQWMENYGYYQGFDVQATGVAAAPTITSVTTPNGTNRPMICFNKPMSTSGGFAADDLDKYIISGFSYNAILKNADNTCFTLVIANSPGLQTNSTYTVTVTDVADANGNVISPNPINFSFTPADSTNPTVSAVAQPGTYTLVVKFSEAIDTTTATTGAFRWDSQNFSGNVRFRTGTLTNEQVRLDFICTDNSTGQPTSCTPPASNGNHALDVKDIKDVAGNTISPNPTSFTVTIVGTNDTTRPTATITPFAEGDLNPTCNSDGTGCVQTQFVNVDYSESMQTQGSGLDSNSTADFTPGTWAIDNLANYSFQNPDGSAATTTCAAGGTAITPVGGSMSRSNQNRFEQRRVRLRLSALFQTGCAYSLVIGPTVSTPVRDEAGNPLNPSPGVFAINVTQDQTAPTVVKVMSNGSKLLIQYSEALAGSTSATTRTNYTSTNSTLQTAITGAPATVPAPDPAEDSVANNQNPYVNMNGDETTVILTFTGNLAPGTYPLTITGVQDPQGNVISPNPTQVTFTVVDTTAPTLTAAAFISTASFSVTYSEPMTAGLGGANSAGNPANYAVNNLGFGALCSSGTVTITSSNNDQTFTIACSVAGNWGTAGTNVVTVRNVADQAGNVINPNPSSKGF